MRTALLSSDQEHAIVVFFTRVTDQAVFFERQRQRLLAEDVLASL